MALIFKMDKYIKYSGTEVRKLTFAEIEKYLDERQQNVLKVYITNSLCEVHTVIMGWNTYHQIVTELSPKMWVYDNLITHVFTHKYYENGAKIKFTNDDAYDFLNLLKS